MVRRMTCLDWKSDSAATVIHRFLKGNGRMHLNGIGGVKFKKTRIEIFGPGFVFNAQRRMSNIQFFNSEGFS